MAQIVIMEPVTESQTYRVFKQPLKGHPNNKINVLLDSGSDGDFISYQKEKTNTFPT